jgi:uncharacterized protein YjbJ (UPF0337 family)
MSLWDKAKNVLDAAKGSPKETADRIEGDENREAEGNADRAVADLKQAGEKAPLDKPGTLLPLPTREAEAYNCPVRLV